MVKRGKRIVSKILCATVLFTMTAVPGAVFAESDEALEAADTGSKAVETEAPDAANEAAQTEQKAAAPAAQKEEAKAPAQEHQAAPKAQAAKSQANAVDTQAARARSVSISGVTESKCDKAVTLTANPSGFISSDYLLTYKWYYKKTANDAGTLLNQDRQVGKISYSADKSGYYYVEVSSIRGTATSSTVQVTINGHDLEWRASGGHHWEGCKNCDYVIRSENHNLTKIKAQAPTCTQNGNEEYWTCDVCNMMFSDAGLTVITEIPIIAKKPHSITKHIEAKAATCTENGTLEHWACEDCGALFWDQAGTKPATEAEVTIPAAHEWDTEYTIDTPATCTAEGTQSKHCKNCDAKTDVQNIAMLPHTLTKTEAKAATCTEPGYDAYWTCDTCKQLFAEESGKEVIDSPRVIEASGHEVELVEKVDATCLKDGHEEYWACKNCDKIFADEACQNELEAPVVIKATGHKFGDWKVVKEPAVDAEGAKERVCEKCGYTETAAIPALDAAKADLTKKTKEAAENKNDDSAKTGDDMNIALYSLLALLAAAGAATTVYRRKTN